MNFKQFLRENEDDANAFNVFIHTLSDPNFNEEYHRARAILESAAFCLIAKSLMRYTNDVNKANKNQDHVAAAVACKVLQQYKLAIDNKPINYVMHLFNKKYEPDDVHLLSTVGGKIDSKNTIAAGSEFIVRYNKIFGSHEVIVVDKSTGKRIKKIYEQSRSDKSGDFVDYKKLPVHRIISLLYKFGCEVQWKSLSSIDYKIYRGSKDGDVFNFIFDFEPELSDDEILQCINRMLPPEGMLASYMHIFSKGQIKEGDALAILESIKKQIKPKTLMSFLRKSNASEKWPLDIVGAPYCNSSDSFADFYVNLSRRIKDEIIKYIVSLARFLQKTGELSL